MEREEIEKLIERLEAHVTECQAGIDHDQYFGEMSSLDHYSADGIRSRDAANALVHLLQAQTWRPIDDEAKNGKPWLLYRDGEQFIGKWYPNSKEFGISAPVPIGDVRVWQSIGPRRFADVIVFEGPTHFRPLPHPPSSFEERESATPSAPPAENDHDT